MMTDEELMRQCLDLARVASEKGDSPVGSLIVQDGRIVARGIEAVKSRSDPTAHAEVEALRSACESLRTLDLSGSVLYTNVEPCWMCSYAIRQTRIARVVFGLRNEKVGGLSPKFRVLVDQELKLPLPDIEAGVLHEECSLFSAEFRPNEPGRVRPGHRDIESVGVTVPRVRPVTALLPGTRRRAIFITYPEGLRCNVWP
jgi:tRNA(adenine34) deaminase